MEITKRPISCLPHAVDQAAQVVGSRAKLADLLGVSVAAIGNWKFRGIPIEYCASIEIATDGVVTRRNLRPKDWQKIWPELTPTGASIAPVATEAEAQGV